MRTQLKNVQGITDSKGNAVSGQQLVEELSQRSVEAKKNQSAALNNLMGGQLNSLASDFNRFANDRDTSVVRREMQSIIDKSNEILKQGTNMGEDIKGKFQKLNKAAQQRLSSLKDAAMFTPTEPVGGIDLNSKNLDLQIQGDAGMITLPVDPVGWDNVKVQGLIPTIIEIKPVMEWGVF